jgi:hypothetical protein
MRTSKSSVKFGFASLLALASALQAAPRQIVFVVQEGANPATTTLFNSYVKKTFSQDEPTGLETLKQQAKTPVAAPAGLTALGGLLKAAATNGYKTGLVTTGEVASVAPLFYGLPAGDAKQIVDAKFDFIAGGGRAPFQTLTAGLKAAGGRAAFDVESLAEEGTGKVLALQADKDLAYNLDNDPEAEAPLSDLVTQAIDTFGEAPFVLVLHDTLLNKAIAAKDTPAAAEQYHAVDDILSSLLDKRDEDPQNFAVALLTTGAPTAPRLVANERSDAFFILSNLPLSFGKAGATLKGATAETLDEFIAEKYTGWKLPADKRAALLAGTLNPETALRASYEPALKIEYVAEAPQNSAWAVGLPPGDLAQSLQTLISTPVKK